MSQCVEVFRLLYRPWSYIVVIFFNTLLSATLILLFVLFFNQGIYGFFFGTTCSSLILALLGSYLVREYLDFSKWHLQWWSKLFRFGAPLVPASLAFFVLSMADRMFIQHYHGAETLGIYSVGAKLSLVAAIAVETFRKAWWPLAMDTMHSEDGKETFRVIARLFMGVGLAGVVYITFLAPWLVKLMTDSQFHDAYFIVAVLAWASLFYGFILISSAGIWRAEKLILFPS